MTDGVLERDHGTLPDRYYSRELHVETRVHIGPRLLRRGDAPADLNGQLVNILLVVDGQQDVLVLLGRVDGGARVVIARKAERAVDGADHALHRPVEHLDSEVLLGGEGGHVRSSEQASCKRYWECAFASVRVGHGEDGDGYGRVRDKRPVGSRSAYGPVLGAAYATDPHLRGVLRQVDAVNASCLQKRALDAKVFLRGDHGQRFSVCENHLDASVAGAEGT